jgi:membrane-bound lytic murein transglycosylase D
MRRRVSLVRSVAVAAVAQLAGVAPSRVASAAPTPPPASAASADDPGGRRAIRGAPVPLAVESEELRRLRELEEESFPRGGAVVADDPVAPPSVRAVGVGPDALPEALRSPSRPSVGLPAAEPAPAIPWLQRLRLPDLPVKLEARTLRYLELYKNDPRGRAIMASWLRREGRWRALFEDALRRAKLPLGLVAVSMIESGFDPHDRSHAGAVGLWQFMPEGARIYGLRIDFWVDERKDPVRSTEAAMRYLGDLKERFGAWPLALAAFNAGYGAVLRAMQKYNTNDYWELTRHEDGLPWETVLYVPKVMAAAIVSANRALFGYDQIPEEPPFGPESVIVPGGTALATLARASGAPVAELEALNPELRRKRTPPGERWAVRVPRGTAAIVAQRLPDVKEAIAPYTMRFGERLDDVARAHGASTRELRAMNAIEDASEVRPGLTIVVPAGRKPLGPSTPPETVIVAVPDKDAVVAGRKRVFYRTLPTDTIADIASFFGVKASDLQRWNNLDAEARLASGMVLQIWVAEELDTSRAALVDPAIVRVVTTGSDEFFDLVEARRGRVRMPYVVKKGDDLARIGKRFGLTVADLERINRFGHKASPITVGQTIVVYRELSAAEKRAAAEKITPGGVKPPAPLPPEVDPGIDGGGEWATLRDADDAAPIAPGDVRLPRPPPKELDDAAGRPPE